MARSYPGNVRLQSFYTENFDRENIARINFYSAQKRGDIGSATIQKGAPSGLPQINPMQFARKKKMEEDENRHRIIDKARRKFNADVEMRPAPERMKTVLFDGFTKEEKGRYQYLKQRHKENPEQKFTYPVTSALEYGWKIMDEDLRRSRYALSNTTKYSFYTRNRVPDLSAPSNPGLYSSAAVQY